MTRASAGIEHLAAHRAVGDQLLDHGLWSADVPRHRDAGFIPVELVEIGPLNFVSHAWHRTPGIGGCERPRIGRRLVPVTLTSPSGLHEHFWHSASAWMRS